MPLTKERGALIRETHAGSRERAVCEAHNLTQVGGSRTKVDGANDTERKSIKNASGSSTQVHITTQKHFAEVMNLPANCSLFLHLFCGHSGLNNNGKDRLTVAEIDPELSQAFATWLTDNKQKVIEMCISNGDDITSVVYRDIKAGVEYELTTPEIYDRIQDAEWVFLSGGIHLKLNGKTLFHLQREGKKRPSNRYNTLFHIHRNLFL
jgi:hypothetical protein